MRRPNNIKPATVKIADLINPEARYASPTRKPPRMLELHEPMAVGALAGHGVPRVGPHSSQSRHAGTLRSQLPQVRRMRLRGTEATAETDERRQWPPTGRASGRARPNGCDRYSDIRNAISSGKGRSARSCECPSTPDASFVWREEPIPRRKMIIGVGWGS